MNSFPPQFLNQLIAGGVETTVCCNSSIPVLQILQMIKFSSTSTAPHRAAVWETRVYIARIETSKAWKGKHFLAYFRIPSPLETFKDTART